MRKRRARGSAGRNSPSSTERQRAQLLAQLDDETTIEAALEKLADLDRKGSDSSALPAFIPTIAMRRYLFAARKIFASGRAYTQRLAASEAGVHEDVVGRWHRVAGFDEWLEGEMYAECDRRLALVANACVQRLLRTGDPKEFETMLRVRAKLPSGYAAPPPEAGPGAASYVLNLLVPRPEPVPVVEKR